MDKPNERFTNLFQQLGLPSDIKGINFFLAENSPLSGRIRLEEAPFWTSSQASFLRETIQMDADWTDVVDQLNVAMRGPHTGA
jgi:Protein of unknown function (DUF2789)